MLHRLVGCVAVLLGVASCGGQPVGFGEPTDEPRATATVEVSVPVRQHVIGVYPPSGSCHTVVVDGQYRADRGCTPGAFDPRVTDANVLLTACVSGWSRQVRPRAAETGVAERRLIVSYGLSGGVADSELDHLVPLHGLGGSSDVRNLWPEPGGVPNTKDRDESRLARLVCAGKLTLSAARAQIVERWAR